MPVPILLLVAPPAVVAVAAAVRHLLESNNTKPPSRKKQTKVVIVGPRLAGKTELHRHLMSRSRAEGDVDEPNESFRPETEHIDIDGLITKIKVTDLPSNQRIGHDLAELLSAADLVVMVVDASLVDRMDYRAEAESRATSMRSISETDQASWILVLTHRDLVRDVEQGTAAASKLAKILDDENPFLCDLTDETSATEVVDHILARIGELQQ